MIAFDYRGTVCSLNQKYISRRFVLSPKYRNAKLELAYVAKREAKGIFYKDENLKVELDLRYPRKGTDIDAWIKFTLDALTGIIYSDDQQIFELNVKKIYCKKADQGFSIKISIIE